MAIESLRGGRNSQVYKVVCDNQTQYAVKHYFYHPWDCRDRLKVEFSALKFLWEHGVRCIPRPIIADKNASVAVYQYITGKPITSAEVSNAEIDYLVDFLIELKGLNDCRGSRQQPMASESCFSLQAIFENVQVRLHNLTALPAKGEEYAALRHFLANDFVPALAVVGAWGKTYAQKAGIALTGELPFRERTLSPSDFGFHNALRLKDGRIVFLDFEYFGWDDPAKMIADFLLHPGMEPAESLKRRFVAKFADSFDYREKLVQRVELVYPLFGLKWVLTLLNEFLPEHSLRRGFARGWVGKIGDLRAVQLAKAKRLLARIRGEYENFSYRHATPGTVHPAVG